MFQALSCAFALRRVRGAPAPSRNTKRQPLEPWRMRVIADEWPAPVRRQAMAVRRVGAPGGAPAVRGRG